MSLKRNRKEEDAPREKLGYKKTALVRSFIICWKTGWDETSLRNRNSSWKIKLKCQEHVKILGYMLIDWFISWSIDWLIDCDTWRNGLFSEFKLLCLKKIFLIFFTRVVNSIYGGPVLCVDWYIDCLANWLIDWLIDWM